MTTGSAFLVTGLEIKALITPEFESILTSDALNFVASLHIKFNKRRLELLQKRTVRQKQINDGFLPNFLSK